MSRKLAASSVLALIVLTLTFIATATAGPLDKLMMPGELSSAHAKLEDNCNNCHKVLQREAQSSLCLSCHKDVAKDVTDKTGFHGRNLLATKSECFACHVEHQGRTKSIISLDPLIFDHADTNYPLGGRHKEADCAGCHVSGKKFREASQTCISCHEQDQPHRGNLGNNCESCHVVDSWKKVAAFDHERTKFPLRGGHLNVACISCHVGEIYKELDTTCISCHALQDVHNKRFGADCQSCHTVETWKNAKFDHDTQTKFPLKGAHATAKCSDCHGADVRAKVLTTCISCHATQDVHKGQLGASCEACHGTLSWKQNVKFDHGLSRFPLTGLHVIVACELCHATQVFKGTPLTCISCHAKDDTHQGRFATRCGSCHSTLGWKRVTFDHGRDTTYPLTGKHAATGCYNCHKTPASANAKLPTDCYACHKAQDVHRGAYGTNCARCHSTVTFREAIIHQ